MTGRTYILILSFLLSASLIFARDKEPEIKNKFVSFRFDPTDFSLTGFTDLITGKEHISLPKDGGSLWQLDFSKGEQVISVSNNQAGPGNAVITYTGGIRTMHIRWEDLSLPELKNVAVEVTVNLPDSSGIADWHIRVENRSGEWGLWEVYFPRFKGFLEKGKYDVFGAFGRDNMPRESTGSLYKGYGGRLDLQYPFGWGGLSMQFIGANYGEGGIYMATHDPGAWYKKFILEPGNEFYIKTWPEDMGVPGSGFDDPFPVMLGVFEGGWITAAHLYRDFALTAPWTSRGKLSVSDTPGSFKDVGLWTVESDYEQDTAFIKNKINEWHKARKFFGVPMGFHWYNWNIYPFDTHYPHYFPPRKGTIEITRDLTSSDFVVMPYINGRITDKSNPDFISLLPFACKRNDGSTYEEVYPSGKPQMPMCPASVPFQDTIVNIVRKLIDDVGANAVYIDQIGAAPPLLCFDKRHGHPLGGGPYWTDGYRQMLQKVRKVAHSDGNDVAITTECTAEPFMDGVDGFLMVNPRSEYSIPLLQAVYSGYTVYFSSWSESIGFSNERFIPLTGRDVCWGIKAGRFELNVFDPGNEQKRNFLRTCGQTLYTGRKYLLYGEFLQQFASVDKSDSNGIPWQMATLWKGEDGSLGLIAGNFSNEAAVFPVAINTGTITGYPWEKASIHDIDDHDNTGLKFKKPIVKGAVKLEPRSFRIIVLEPAK